MSQRSFMLFASLLLIIILLASPRPTEGNADRALEDVLDKNPALKRLWQEGAETFLVCRKCSADGHGRLRCDYNESSDNSNHDPKTPSPQPNSDPEINLPTTSTTTTTTTTTPKPKPPVPKPSKIIRLSLPVPSSDFEKDGYCGGKDGWNKKEGEICYSKFNQANEVIESGCMNDGTKEGCTFGTNGVKTCYCNTKIEYPTKQAKDQTDEEFEKQTIRFQQSLICNINLNTDSYIKNRKSLATSLRFTTRNTFTALVFLPIFMTIN